MFFPESPFAQTPMAREYSWKIVSMLFRFYSFIDLNKISHEIVSVGFSDKNFTEESFDVTNRF